MTTALQGNELETYSRFKAKPRKKYKFWKEPLVNAEVFSKIIWRLFSLLITEEKHGGWNSFSFDAQCGYYPEHQRNNEWCCPYFPLAVSKRAIVSLVSVWKRSCNFALASFPKRKWREGKERKKKQQQKGDGKEEGENRVLQQMACWCLGIGHEFQWEIITSRNFPRTASVELLWEVVSRHRSSFDIYCCNHAWVVPGFCCPSQCWGWD